MQEFLKVAKDKCQNTKLIGIIGGIILVIGNFFNYATANIFGFKQGLSFASVAGGKILIVLGILYLVLLFKDFIKPKLPANVLEKVKILDNTKILLIPVAISIITILISNGKIFDGYGIVKASFGCYLLWIGIIISAVYPFIYKENKKDVVIEVKKESV